MSALAEKIGRGHFGVVRLAEHALTKEKVAVKIIDKSDLDAVCPSVIPRGRCRPRGLCVRSMPLCVLCDVWMGSSQANVVIRLGSHSPLYLTGQLPIIPHSQEVREQLYNEVRFMKLLKHPHIIGLYEVRMVLALA